MPLNPQYSLEMLFAQCVKQEVKLYCSCSKEVSVAVTARVNAPQLPFDVYFICSNIVV